MVMFSPFVILFFVFLSSRLYTDYSYKQSSSLSDSTYVKRFSYYLGNDEKEVCLDIELYNKEYRIRLRHTAKEDWVNINDYTNLDQPIKYLYIPSQLKDDTILYDPSQLEINRKMILGFEVSKRHAKRLLVFVIGIILLFLFFFFLALQTYRKDLYSSDKLLWKKRKYKKLISIFLFGN